MDNIYEISLLLDFYGQLLTARQYEILDLHYNNDYSLGEIGEQLGISRQGVYDNIKRAKSTLQELENKLGLVKRFGVQKNRALQILDNLKNINIEDLSADDRERIKIAEDGIKDIINSI